MKKKYFFCFAFAGIALFTGCKKQRSCQCSSIYEKPGYYPFSATSIEPISEKTTKHRAEKFVPIPKNKWLKITRIMLPGMRPLLYPAL